MKVVANTSWLGALQPASQEAAEFLADLIYTKKYDEKVKSVLHTNFDVNALGSSSLSGILSRVFREKRRPPAIALRHVS